MSGYNYKTILVDESPKIVTVTINRNKQNNSINGLLLKEVNILLDSVEQDPNVRIILLKGQKGVFCTGMDFDEVSKIDHKNRDEVKKYVSDYYNILERITNTSKIIVSIVDGKANAGGIGFVAASDFSIATERAVFSLSEALFGLLPASVIPFLIRRVGFQKAYLMTLTAQQIKARRAYEIGLIDELTNTPEESLRRFLLKTNRVKEETIVTLKQYFKKMWIIDEQMGNNAVNQITDLINNRENLEVIRNFVEKGLFPWEN